MRLSTTVAIFGPCCAGKSVVARAVALRLGFPVLHCGDAIRAAAREAGVSPAELDAASHRKIDSATATRAVASPLVVEGTFLDHVLAQCKGLLLLRLACNDAQRELRFSARGGAPGTLSGRDAADEALRMRLFKGAPARQPDFVIDTTELTIEEVAIQVLARLDQQ